MVRGHCVAVVTWCPKCPEKKNHPHLQADTSFHKLFWMSSLKNLETGKSIKVSDWLQCYVQPITGRNHWEPTSPWQGGEGQGNPQGRRWKWPQLPIRQVIREDLSCNQGSPGCLCRHPVSIIGSIHATNFKPFMGIILILYEPCLPSSTLLRLQKRPKPRLPSWPRCLQHLQTDSVIMDFLVFYVR